MELPNGTLRGPFSRAEWLAERRKGIGGSDCAAILGLPTFSSALEVYNSKVLDVADDDSSEHMQWGSILEPVILDQWLEQVDKEAFAAQVIIQSNDHPYLLHSPDGLVVNDRQPGTYEAGVEVKVIRSDKDWKSDETQGLPAVYYAQVQHGLLCSGLPKWNVVALVSGQKLITREVFPDEMFQRELAAACGYFWTRHVLRNDPPAPDGSDSAQNALNEAWDASPGTVEVPYELVGELQAVSEELKVIETEKKRLQQQLEQLLGESDTATVDGVPVATWKAQVSNRLDTKALRASEPELAKKYTKPSTNRVFRLK